jgi:bacteriocin-like protein
MERELSENELDAVSGGIFEIFRTMISVMQCEQYFAQYRGRTGFQTCAGGTASLSGQPG